MSELEIQNPKNQEVQEKLSCRESEGVPRSISLSYPQEWGTRGLIGSYEIAPWSGA
jgi:hypothetical protein